MAQPSRTGARWENAAHETRVSGSFGKNGRRSTIRFIPRVHTFPRNGRTSRHEASHFGWSHPGGQPSRWTRDATRWLSHRMTRLMSEAPIEATPIEPDDLAFGISPALRARAAKIGPTFGLGLRRGRVPRAAIGGGYPGPSLAVHRVVSERGNRMMKRPVIASLHTVSLTEALAYLDAADGDELTAAWELARDRNALDGSDAEPDDTEIHHAFFLIQRARGLQAPSFDQLRVQLKRRLAA